jgi:hypothetical protein
MPRNPFDPPPPPRLKLAEVFDLLDNHFSGRRDLLSALLRFLVAGGITGHAASADWFEGPPPPPPPPAPPPPPPSPFPNSPPYGMGGSWTGPGGMGPNFDPRDFPIRRRQWYLDWQVPVSFWADLRGDWNALAGESIRSIGQDSFTDARDFTFDEQGVLALRDWQHGPSREGIRQAARYAFRAQVAPGAGEGRIDVLLDRARAMLKASEAEEAAARRPMPGVERAKRRIALLEALRKEEDWRQVLLASGIPVVDQPDNPWSRGSVAGGPYLWDGADRLNAHRALHSASRLAAQPGDGKMPAPDHHPQYLLADLRPPECPPPPVLGTDYDAEGLDRWPALAKAEGAWSPKLRSIVPQVIPEKRSAPKA